jgi:hypothetical protein
MDATTVTLQIAFEGDSPVGRAVGADGVTREFTGWLGLVTAIEDLAGDRRDLVNDPRQPRA